MALPAVLLSFATLVAPPSSTAAPARPADSVVKVLASIRYPNPTQPWARTRAVDVAGSGVVIAGNRILTNAHLVLYATEVQVQAGPGADKVNATVESVGPDIDLAVLTVADKKFFQKRPPLPRAAALPEVRDSVEVYGFPVGGDDLSVTRGVVSRIGYGPYYGATAGLILQVSAAINEGNSGGPAVVGGKMVGLVFSRLQDAENIGYVIPNEEIDLFLEDVKDGRYDGKPFDATGAQYQRLENESLRGLLKLDRRTRGVVVVPPRRPVAGNPFQEFDVLTRVGEHAVDNDGMIHVPGRPAIPFYALLSRLGGRGQVPVSVIRQGKQVRLSVPVTTRDSRLIKEFRGEQPSYFVHGPLVFSPAREEAVRLYFRMNPGLAVSGSPLLSRRYDRARFPGEELVVVTAPMFQHKLAKGYADPVGQVLEEVNGQKVKNLRHLVELLRDSTEEFLKLRFAEESSEVLVFRRAEMNRVTEDVLEEAGIAPSRRGSPDMLAVWKRPGEGK